LLSEQRLDRTLEEIQLVRGTRAWQMLGPIRRLLDGPEGVGWLQPLPREAPRDRRELILEIARGRRVIHLGFTDERQTEAKLRDGRWLHASLAEVADQLVGLDVDEAGVAQAKAAGFEAHVVDVQDRAALASLGLEPADVVIAGEIIEHLASPGAFLSAVMILIKEDGQLVVTTPNAYRVPGFVAPLLGQELIHPDHVGIHSIHTLRTLGIRSGYRVDRLGYYQNRALVPSSLTGWIVKFVRSLQLRVLRRWPHWSDGIYAIYSRDPSA
jgi:SAM-dependent methyltransferase